MALEFGLHCIDLDIMNMNLINIIVVYLIITQHFNIDNIDTIFTNILFVSVSDFRTPQKC